MSTQHYWLGRIHGMMEAKAIADKASRLGMSRSDCLDLVEQIADEIPLDLDLGDKQMLAARLAWEDLQELPPELVQEVRGSP